MSALARLAIEFSSTPGVETLLGGRAVTELEADFEAGRWRHVASATPPGGSGGERFASAVQEEFWVAGIGPHGSTPLNIVVALDIDGRVDPGRLRDALRGTVAAHEELRSTLSARARRLTIRLLDHVDPELSIVSVADGVELEAVTQAFADRSFAVETDVPVRSALVSSPSGDHILLAVHHHVADDEGFHAFVDEIAGRCTAGPDVSVPAPAATEAVEDVLADDPAALDYLASTLAGVGSDAITWLQRGRQLAERQVRAAGGQAGIRPTPACPRKHAVRRSAGVISARGPIRGGTRRAARRHGGQPPPGTRRHRRHHGLPHHAVAVAAHRRGYMGTDRGRHPGILTTALAHRQVAFSSLARFLPPAHRGPLITFGAERQEGRAVRIGRATSRMRFVAPSIGQSPLMATVEGDGPSPAFRIAFDDGLPPADLVGRLFKRWC